MKLLVTGGCGFIGSNFSSPVSLLTPQLARLAAIGGFRGWEKMVSKFITDESMVRNCPAPFVPCSSSA